MSYYSDEGATAADAQGNDITSYITKIVQKYNAGTSSWDTIAEINDPHANPWDVPYISKKDGDKYKIIYNVKDINNVAAEPKTRLINIIVPYPTFTFVVTGFNDDSSHQEDWSGYGIGYRSVGGSSTQQGEYFNPRNSSGHTHDSGQRHTHDKWGLGSLAMNKDGTILIGGAHSQPVSSGDSYALYRGYAQAYKFDGSNWVKHGRRILQWDREDGGSHFVRSYYGRAVAMNGAGDIMAVSMYQWQWNAGDDQGDVTIYKWDEATGDWVYRQKSTRFHTGEDSYNGVCISMDETGDKLFIVAGKGTGQPILERYDWNGSSYQLAHTLPTTGMSQILGFDSDPEGPNGVLHSTLDAEHVLFGCNNKVRAYQWNGSSYVTKGSDFSRTRGSGGTMDDVGVNQHLTNAKISEDGNFLAFTSNSTVVSYDWNGSSWVARPAITDSGQPWFGSGLDIADKNTLVIGNPQGNPDSDGAPVADDDAVGRVRVYIYDGSAWAIQETLLGRNETGAKFGNTVVCSRS